MAEATHDDIVARIESLEEGQDSLEERMKAVEKGVNENHQVALSIQSEVSLWGGYLKGAIFTLKGIGWVIGTGIALAAVLSQI